MGYGLSWFETALKKRLLTMRTKKRYEFANVRGSP